MKVHYRILLRFVLANISPHLRASDCNENLDHHLYHMMHRIPVNLLPRLKFMNITDVKHTNLLPTPYLMGAW